jgi:hypothetical protein
MMPVEAKWLRPHLLCLAPSSLVTERQQSADRFPRRARCVRSWRDAGNRYAGLQGSTRFLLLLTVCTHPTQPSSPKCSLCKNFRSRFRLLHSRPSRLDPAEAKRQNLDSAHVRQFVFRSAPSQRLFPLLSDFPYSSALTCFQFNGPRTVERQGCPDRRPAARQVRKQLA